MKIIRYLIILLLIQSTSFLSAQIPNYNSVKNVDLSSQFNGFAGSFVLLDINNDKYFIFNDSLSKEKFSPCSTFKIANSLIALESGLADDANYLIEYDSIKNPPQAWMFENEPFKHWMQNHTMATAIKYSVVWYYQELARRIGKEKMSAYLKKLNYGNNDISSGIDQFWLCGSLTVSAFEQVQFLKKLYQEKLEGFSKYSQQTVKNIMLYEVNTNYQLYGKTGGGDCSKNQVIGWYVGFVKTNSNAYIFAMNIFVKDFNDLRRNDRIALTKLILKELGVI